MDLVTFLLAYSLIWILSRFPFRILYLFSDFIYFLIYYIIPYRKKIVLKNLTLSFPQKNQKEIRQIAKKFYRYFCDSMIETLAGFNLSITENNKRYRYKNIDLIHNLYRKKKSIILVLGHYGNWEWMINLQKKIEYIFLGIYKPLHNKYFDTFIKKTREKTGSIAVPMDKTLRVILEHQKRKIPTMTMFIADQRPIWENIQHWTTFMNQDTPVLLGPEKIARKTGQVVVFYKVDRTRRGYYESEFILLSDDPKTTNPYEITERYFQILEKTIREKPELYLWTHNRWKHEKAKFNSSKILKPYENLSDQVNPSRL